MISKKGIDLIKKFEGCVLKTYKCPAGIPTIGYGHAIDHKEDEGLIDHFAKGIDQDEAEDILQSDINKVEDKINSLNLELTQNQKDALCSLIFNIGFNRFKRSQTFKTLEQKDFDQMHFEWMGFSKIRKGDTLVESHGLATRRKAELDLFFS